MNPPLLRTLIDAQASALADRPFLTFEGHTYSYRQTDHASNRAANLLRELGVRPQDRVAVLLPNSQHFVFVWLALIKLNATMTPLNIQLKGDTLHYQLHHSAPRLLITTRSLLPNVEAVRHALPDDCRVLVIDRDPNVHGPLDHGFDYQSLFNQASGERPPDVRVDDEDLALILYTSGTTGRPKGVMINRRAQTHHPTYYHADLLRTARGETAYTYLPLFHVTSMGVTMGQWVGGGHVALDEDFNVFGFWDRIRQHQAVVFPYLGAVLSMLHARPPRPDDADNPARFALGAAAPVAIWKSFEQRFGLQLLETYGQSEWVAVWVQHPRGKTRVGAAGVAPARAEVHVVDANDARVPPNTAGEIIMRPTQPHLMMTGYYNNPELTAQVFREGWYHTGDVGSLDEDGYLTFKGRLKDYIRRRGENISSFDIEQVVNQHPAVLECAAVGVPSALSEDEVKLCVVLRPESLAQPPTAEVLWRYCKQTLPHFMVPRYIEILDALPRTATHRVRKFVLAEQGVAGAWDCKAKPRGL